jgi:hypothetical protein
MSIRLGVKRRQAGKSEQLGASGFDRLGSIDLDGWNASSMQDFLGDVDGGHHETHHAVSVLVPGLSDKPAGAVALLYDLGRAFGEGHADGDRHQLEIGAQLLQVDAEIHHAPAEAQASLGEGGLDVNAHWADLIWLL